MTTSDKVCPRCRTAAQLQAAQCARCSHVYKTQFTAPATPAARPVPPAPPATPRPTPAPRLAAARPGKAKLNGLQIGCLTVFGLLGALLLLGTLVSGSNGQWRPVHHLDVPTRQFHSPYPWVEVVRHADGQRGFLIYAPVDQIPSDWPPVGLTRGQNLGYWQFALADGTVEPDREGVREHNLWLVWDSSQESGGNPLINLGWAVTADNEGPPDFAFTPAGQQTYNSLRGQ